MLLLRSQLSSIHAEELVRLSGMLARDVVESRSSDVVCLALAHQAVVLEQVLLLRVVDVCLFLEDPFGLAPKDR